MYSVSAIERSTSRLIRAGTGANYGSVARFKVVMVSSQTGVLRPQPEQ